MQVGGCGLQAAASAAWNRKPAPAVMEKVCVGARTGGAPGPHTTPRMLASGNQPNNITPHACVPAHVCEALGAHHGDVGKGDGQDEGGAVGRGSHAAKALLWGAEGRCGRGDERSGRGREVREGL